MKLIQHLILIFLLSLFGCGNNSVETQIITEIVQVPPPEPDATDITLNITASQLDGTLTNNGNAFPENIYEDGDIVFRSGAGTDEFVVGSTPLQNYQSLVVDQDYDILYRVDSSGPQVPINQNAIILDGRTISGNETIDLDVVSVEITPVFTLNGVSFPASQYDHGLFYLQPVGTNELILIGDTATNNQPVRIIPGEYHVIYDYVQGVISPVNKGAKVMTNLELDSDQVLAVDVSSGDFRASFTLNGNSFPSSQYDHAEFYLLDQETASESFIMKSYESVVSVPVIDGNYDILYKVVQSGSIPINTAKIIVNNLTLSSGGALNQDVASIDIDANVTLNGQAFQVSEYQDGIIEIYDVETDSYTELGNTHGEFSGITILPGTYDITYSHESGDAVPQNTHGIVASEQLLDSGGPIDVAVTGILVSPNLTLNTAAFPPSQYQTADLILTGAQSSDDIFVSKTNSQEESVMVLAGNYDLYYRHKQGEDVPQNSNYRILASQDLQEDSELTADIKGVYIRIAATLNQQAFPQSQYQTGDIYASSGEGDEIFVLETHNEGDALMVIPEDYEFFYQHIGGDTVPQNNWAPIGNATVTEPPS